MNNSLSLTFHLHYTDQHCLYLLYLTQINIIIFCYDFTYTYELKKLIKSLIISLRRCGIKIPKRIKKFTRRNKYCSLQQENFCLLDRIYLGLFLSLSPSLSKLCFSFSLALSSLSLTKFASEV